MLTCPGLVVWYQELNLLGLIHNIERLIVDKLGGQRAFLINVKRVSIKRGTILYTCHDITKRRHAEEALRRSQVQMALYRIVQEALINITRYAQASHVHVRLECQESTIVIIIEDDRQGFDPETVAFRGGVGLLGIRERAALLGGSLSIKSQSGQGTRLTLHIPWSEAHEQNQHAVG